ncbi:MAG: hypothetical protein ACOC93_02460 [Planctomycetota bacterium]
MAHLRSRRLRGNACWLLLMLISAALTQRLREQALESEHAIPAGLAETTAAAAACGLRVSYQSSTGWTLHQTCKTRYTKTFKHALCVAYQYRFKFAAA